MNSFSKLLMSLAAMVLASMCHGADKIEFGNITNSTPMYTAAAVDELISGGLGGGLTTNDVCNIVTNEAIVGFTLWTIYRNGVDVTDSILQPMYIGGEWDCYALSNDEYPYSQSNPWPDEANQTNLEWYTETDEELIHYTATRQPITRNAIGLARLIDLPTAVSQLTNDVGFVTTNIEGNVSIKGTLIQGDVGVNDSDIDRLAATGERASAFGRSVASGKYSHAEGGGGSISTNLLGMPMKVPIASGGYAHAQNTHTLASGSHSHAEGSLTCAVGRGAHAEGQQTISAGQWSHSQNFYTVVSSDFSHVEGAYTRAVDGMASHAEGLYTLAAKTNTHAAGLYAYATNHNSYVWNGDADSTATNAVPYGSHGIGTFNVNPKNGINGFYIGETNLADHIANISTTYGNYEAVSNAAMNALSRAEAKAGFTEWVTTSTETENPQRIVWYEGETSGWVVEEFSDGEWQLSSGPKGDSSSVSLTWSSVEARHDCTATRTRLPTWADITNVTTKLDAKTSTNDVCNIVTNTITEYTEWEIAITNRTLSDEGLAAWREVNHDETIGGDVTISKNGFSWQVFIGGLEASDGLMVSTNNPETAVYVNGWSGLETYLGLIPQETTVATRQAVTRNALGLARLIDLPPLTNGLPEAMASKASTNDVQLTPVYSPTPTFSEWTILRDGEDVTSLVQQPEYKEEDEYGEHYWQVYLVEGDDPGVDQYEEPVDINRLIWSDVDDAHQYTATRTRTDIIGYMLGSQTNAVLASTNDLVTITQYTDITNRLAIIEAKLNALSNISFPKYTINSNTETISNIIDTIKKN